MKVEQTVGDVPYERPVIQSPMIQRIGRDKATERSITVAAIIVNMFAAIIVNRRPKVSKMTPVSMRPRPLQMARMPTSVVATVALISTERARSRAKLIMEFPTAVMQISARKARQNVKRRNISIGL